MRRGKAPGEYRPPTPTVERLVQALAGIESQLISPFITCDALREALGARKIRGRGQLAEAAYRRGWRRWSKGCWLVHPMIIKGADLKGSDACAVPCVAEPLVDGTTKPLLTALPRGRHSPRERGSPSPSIRRK